MHQDAHPAFQLSRQEDHSVARHTLDRSALEHLVAVTAHSSVCASSLRSVNRQEKAIHSNSKYSCEERRIGSYFCTRFLWPSQSEETTERRVGFYVCARIFEPYQFCWTKSTRQTVRQHLIGVTPKVKQMLA